MTTTKVAFARSLSFIYRGQCRKKNISDKCSWHQGLASIALRERVRSRLENKFLPIPRIKRNHFRQPHEPACAETRILFLKQPRQKSPRHSTRSPHALVCKSVATATADSRLLFKKKGNKRNETHHNLLSASVFPAIVVKETPLLLAHVEAELALSPRTQIKPQCPKQKHAHSASPHPQRNKAYVLHTRTRAKTHTIDICTRKIKHVEQKPRGVQRVLHHFHVVHCTRVEGLNAALVLQRVEQGGLATTTRAHENNVLRDHSPHNVL